MVHAAAEGRTAVSGFMNPEEQYRASSYLKKDEDDCFYIFFGGYADAERRRLFIFPTYYAADKEYIDSKITASAVAVYIRGSGYERMTHRSFMGAVLALGIERDTIGDIIVRDERDAVVLCDEKITGFLFSEPCPLEYVGHDKVKIERYTLPVTFDAGRRYEQISDTVASARLDSIVAALTGLSREKAKTAVKSGVVCLNFIENTDCDSDVNDNDIISVRGSGKYKIKDVNTKTRKNRLRLFALKYI